MKRYLSYSHLALCIVFLCISCLRKAREDNDPYYETTAENKKIITQKKICESNSNMAYRNNTCILKNPSLISSCNKQSSTEWDDKQNICKEKNSETAPF